jgi:uncharacterized SAM-binding protein YcdF (DUF218 family)
MNEYEEFKNLLLWQVPQKADAIVLLAGDRFHRTLKVAELYHTAMAPSVVVTSSAHNYAYGSLPAHVLVRKLTALGVPEEHIIWEETGAHTRAEADATLRLAQKHGWKTLLVVTTEYHQYRAFLTLVKAMRDLKMELKLIMVSENKFPQFHSKTHEETITGEMERITVYQQKGDVASLQEGILYLQKG